MQLQHLGDMHCARENKHVTSVTQCPSRSECEQSKVGSQFFVYRAAHPQ